MTCQHNYMQSTTDSRFRFCCICGEPEPVEENFGRTDVCEHGSLRRKCPICERDEEIARLRGYLKKIRDLGCREGFDFFRDMDMTAIAIVALGHGANPAQKATP